MSKPDIKVLLRNFKRALKEIASGECCGCCTKEEPEKCDVGIARTALKYKENY